MYLEVMLGTQLPDTLILPLPLSTDFERPRDGRQARAGRREDAGQIGIFGGQRDGRVERLLLVVVAVDLVDDLDVRDTCDISS